MLWFIVINWYNRLHDSFKKYDTYYHFLILSEIWVLSAFRDQSKDHVTISIIVSLISNDTSNVHWLITMIWYNIYWWFDRRMLIQNPFLSHYILNDTIYYIDSIKSVVTVILSDSLELNDTIITNDSFSHNGTLWLRESLLIDGTCRIIWAIPMKFDTNLNPLIHYYIMIQLKVLIHYVILIQAPYYGSI